VALLHQSISRFGLFVIIIIIVVIPLLLYMMKMIFVKSMGWDDVSELRPPTGILLILQVIYEYGAPRWNSIDRKES
jgi:hypothetical protein